MDPLFVRLDEAVDIHRDQLERYGGAPGIRDLGLLQSAVATARATFGGQFLHTDLYEMAAAYLFHIARNHPFVDGNKRTAAVAAAVFLALNGRELDADEASFEALVRAVAEGRAGKAAGAQFFREHTRPTGIP